MSSISARPGIRRKSSAILHALPGSSSRQHHQIDDADFLLDDRSDSFSIAPSMSSAANSAYSAAGSGYSINGTAGLSSTGGSGGGGPGSAGATGTARSHNQDLDTLRFQVQKRITTFVYLKKAHEGRVHWFNTVLLSKSDLEAAFSPQRMQQRTMRFTVLGLSFASLMDIMTPLDFLRGLLHLLQEYEAIPDANFKPRVRGIFRQNKSQRKSTTGSADYPLSIQESGETSYLFSPNVPFDLDYFQVLFALCDSIVEIYQKIFGFLSPGSTPSASFQSGTFTPSSSALMPGGSSAAASPSASTTNLVVPTWGPSAASGASSSTPLNAAGCEMVSKIDARLKRIVTVITKELDAIARNAIRDEVSKLELMLGGSNGSADFGGEGSIFGD